MEDMNNMQYEPPEILGLDGEDQIATYGTEWIWETYYVTYVNGAVAGDTVVVCFNI
ncbi:MAG: hypothetical protein HFH49_01645 [Lachnospiraceae bacterium]|nr:hypothetical protein [Lachnospiraceae bacterium]